MSAAEALPFESQKTEHELRPLRHPAQLIVMLGLGVVVAMSLGTQWTADRFGYHANLGAPLYTGSIPAMLGLSLAALCVGLAAVCVFHPVQRRMSLAVVVVAALFVAASRGPLYSPFDLIGWVVAYNGVGDAGVIVTHGVHAAVYAMALTIPAVMMPVVLSGRRLKVASTAHGSASLSDGAGYAVDPAEFLAARALIDREMERVETAAGFAGTFRP